MSTLFAVHRLNEGGLKNAELIAEAFNECLERITALAGPGASTREFSLARTKMEEACFFAKKAMANNPDNQA